MRNVATHWVVEGIFAYHEADGTHVYDIVRYAHPPVTTYHDTRTTHDAHRCGACRTVFRLAGDHPGGGVAEEGENRHGEPYQLVVPLCPDCAVREGAVS